MCGRLDIFQTDVVDLRPSSRKAKKGSDKVLQARVFPFSARNVFWGVCDLMPGMAYKICESQDLFFHDDSRHIASMWVPVNAKDEKRPKL